MKLHYRNLSRPAWAAFLLACVLLPAALTAQPRAPGSATEQTKDDAPPPPSASALDVYGRFKDRLHQVRVLLSDANEQASLGSGFAVRSDASGSSWFVTNYHVVSSLAIDPQKYKLELRSTDGKTVSAQLVAIDVIHDLAVLRTDPSGTARPVLKMQANLPTQGAKVFALGNPKELGFLVAEGLYNGLVERKAYDQMLFSGSLNSGMSGGPALNANGDAIGINVSTRRDGEQLSFLVPARYAAALLERALPVKTPPTEWRTEVARQLLTHQDHLFAQVQRTGFTRQTLSGMSLPTLPDELTRCWASASDKDGAKFTDSSLSCAKQESLYVANGIYAGSIELRHSHQKNTRLATLQFLRLGASPSGGGYAWQGRGERTRSECHDAFVTPSKSARTYRVSTCAQAYKKYPGIFDLSWSAVQVDDPQSRLTSTLKVSGFSFANAQRLGADFLKALP